MKVSRKIILALFLSTAIFSFAEKRTAVFDMADGTSAVYQLSETPKLTFAGDSVNVSTANVSVSYLRSNVKKVYFSESSGVKEQLQCNQILFSLVDNNQISLNGLTKGDRIALYGIDGKLLKNVTSTGGTDQLNLSGLSSGIYVVSVNGSHTFKFTHK